MSKLHGMIANRYITYFIVQQLGQEWEILGVPDVVRIAGTERNPGNTVNDLHDR